MSKIQQVAFLGLGAMGAPMAGHLASAGYQVRVYNRHAEKARSWVEAYGGALASTPAEAAEGCQLVCCCVGDDDSVRAMATDEKGAFSAMPEGAIFVDHTTTSAKLAHELAAAAEAQGLAFLDAPVSGGQAGAENGVLTIMVGGDQAAFTRAEPVLQAYARAVTRMGDSGAGQLAKMVNQICIAGLVQGLSEGLAFSERAGLDTKRVLEVISKGAAQSWQMENRGNTMVDGKFDFGFAVDHMRKDLAICFDEAKSTGAKLPVTELVDQFYADIQAKGGNRWDTSSLITRLS